MALTKVKGHIIETGAVTGDILADGGIATAKLADNAVTTLKISDANITHAKLHTSMDLTGKTVNVATAAGSTNTTAAASTAFVQQEISSLVDGAPSTLNTLNEIAAALNDDAALNTTLTNSIATKAPLATPQFTNRVGIGVAAHGTAGLNITSTAQHMRLNNGSELGIISLESDGALRLWSHGDSNNEIEFYQGSGSGSPSMIINSSGDILGKTADVRIGSDVGAIEYGTSTANSVRFYSDNAEKMRITSAGNVGIGDTSPIAKLTVKAAADTIRAESLATDAKNITMSYHDSNDQGQIFCGQDGVVDKNIVLRGHTLIFQRSGGTEAMRIANDSKILIGTTSNNYARAKFTVFGTPGNPATTGVATDNVAIRVATDSGNSQALDIGMYNSGDYGAWFQASNSGSLNSHSPIALNPNGGKVGIGTATPSYPLHVKGAGHQRIKVEKTDAGGDADISISGRSDSTGWILFTDQQAGANSGVIKYVHNGDYMSFRTNGTDDRIRIASNGKVGIGTSNPVNGVLHVVGDVYSSTRVQGGNTLIGTNSSMAVLGSNSSSVGIALARDFNASTYPDLVVQTNGNVTVGSQGSVIGTKWLSSHENLYWNSKFVYSGGGYGSAPDKWVTQGGNVTITSEHPHNKGFSTSYTNVQSASHTTNINNATPSTPHWKGVYVTFSGATNFGGNQNSSIGGGWEAGEGAIMKCVYNGNGSGSSTNAVRGYQWKNFFSNGSVHTRQSFFYFLESGEFSSGWFAGYGGQYGTDYVHGSTAAEGSTGQHRHTTTGQWVYVNHGCKSYLGATFNNASNGYMHGFGFRPGYATTVWIAIPGLTAQVFNDGKTINIHSAQQQIGQG